MLEKSACHTLDRYDFRAQRDICGVGPTEVWADAVSQKFGINYWPYTNADDYVKDCIEKTFVDSLVNLGKDAATTFATVSFCLVTMFASVSLF